MADIKESGSLLIANQNVDKESLFKSEQVVNEFLKVVQTVYAQKITGGQFPDADLVKEFYEKFVADMAEVQ